MKLKNNEELTASVKDADMVLVGIGEEWGISFEKMMQDPSFVENFQKLPTELEKERFVPYLQRAYLKDGPKGELEKAYENLLCLLRDKDYFLISMNKDKFPVQMGFEGDRCVFPCGSYESFQCDKGCNGEIIDASDAAERIYGEICKDRDIEKIEIPCCNHCKAPLVFNNIEAEKYVEAGYLVAWDRYMKWLQKTVNRKLCLLELGVGLRFPSVIRWPFEKTAFYNQKAKMFRIHHSLSQSTENIQDRCCSKEEDSVTYMANIFVS